MWKIPLEIGIPDHLTCLVQNLHVGQEATELDMEQQTVPNWERSMSRLYIVTLLFNLHAECTVLIAPQLCPSLRPHRLYPTRLLCPWSSPGKNTGVGCHFLLQGIYATQELNPALLHCRQILYHLSHQGIPQGNCIMEYYLAIKRN